jgi:hypothetical protein
MRSDLAELTSDLPAGVPGAALPERAQSSLLGDVKRSGTWVVPAAGVYRSWLGDVSLDLRQARLAGADEIHIHARTLLGDIELLVPEGVEVDVRARATLGDVKLQTEAPAVAGATRIVLTGGTFVGDIKVRHKRMRERLAAFFS